MTWMTLAVPFLQLALKLLPLFYQFKLIRSQEDLRELQERFKRAIQKADGSALDSKKLREQHEANEAELREKWETEWGDSPPSVPPAPEPPPGDDPTPPGNEPPLMTIDREKVETREIFRVTLRNFNRNEVELYADRFKLQTLGYVGALRTVALSLVSPGKRTIYARVGDLVIARADIEVTGR